jgi:ribulose-5-phosphate 4-epimerase/fuculose-1-phosphate aldolase
LLTFYFRQKHCNRIDVNGMKIDENVSADGHNASAAKVRTVREHLAACYRIFAARNMDDLIYTHLSARVPGTSDRFLFIPFGMLFEEVTASNLVEVDIAGEVMSPSNCTVNPAGWIVHRTVYEAVSDARCVMHLHTIAGTAISAQKDGLLPINQFAVTYFGKIAYHEYEGPGLPPAEQRRFVSDLGDKRMMFLRNHGTLTHGRGIAEAFTLMHYLERSCEIQIAAQGGRSLSLPSQEIVAATVATAQGVGDRNFGEVGFEALLRKLEREDPSYRL